MCKNKNTNTLIFASSTVLYKYMELLINDILNLPDHTHVQIGIYREFYHVIVNKTKKGCHNRISKILLFDISSESRMFIGQQSYDNNQWVILRSPVFAKAADDFSLFNLITEEKTAYYYTKSKPLKSCSVLF